MRSPQRHYFWAVLITALYLVLGVAYSVINPIHEATDELRHFRYVRYIADIGELPVQSGEAGNAQAHHPPLYYATAALVSAWVRLDDPLYEPVANPQWGFRNWEVGTDNKNLYIHGPDEGWPYRGPSLAAHLARWTTLLWGAGTVLLTYLIVLRIFPGRHAIALLAAAIAALNPMFLYLGGAINNDVPAGLAGAAITYLCLLVIRNGATDRLALWLGVAYGLASLTKFNLVAMLAVIELALLLAIWTAPAPDQRARWLRWLRANAIIAGVTLAISGWWYVRNIILYGEPTGFLRLTEIWGARDPRAGVQLTGRELGYAWTSLWGRFGYGQIPLPPRFYRGVGILAGVGGLGLAAFITRHSLLRDRPFRRREADTRRISPLLERILRRGGPRERQPDLLPLLTAQQWQMLAVLAASVVINFIVLYAYITVSPAGAMGRFFFPGLPAFAVLISVGVTGLLPRANRAIIAGVITLAMLGFALVALLGYIAPAYQKPPPQAAPTSPSLASKDVVIGDFARILDYQVEGAENMLPGSRVDVTITWEALRRTEVPYTLAIQLRHVQGVLIAERNTYTGHGNYPTSIWEPGRIFTETYHLYLPEYAYAPLDRLYLTVTMFDPEDELAPVRIDGEANGDSFWLASDLQTVARPGSEYPNQTYINFDNHFALVGYSIDPLVLWQGQRTKVTLYWLALDPPRDDNYKVFLHVIKGWDEKWAGADGNPVTHDGRTSTWEAGQVYVDERLLDIPGEIPPDNYELELGWFSDTTGERLNIVAGDGHIIDNWVMLHRIFVDDNPYE
ncbi:MAG: phospholipid carrier-dependent glycosyltransferase [Anaerolineae bacterium]|nr:phospholipid carrier-dependent glycosyltransferase [Anaerolineae bacterium]